MAMDQMYSDCVAELEQVKAERDALAAHVELGSRIVNEWKIGAFGNVAAAAQLDEWLHTKPATSLSRLKAKAFREVAAWMDYDSAAFGGPTHHEAELITMEIAGPTFCSEVPRTMRAGNKAFLEAARIFDLRRQAEGD